MKIDTEITYVFVKGHEGVDWAVFTDRDTLLVIKIGNWLFRGDFCELFEWARKHSFQIVTRRVERDFQVSFERGHFEDANWGFFEDVNWGCRFKRVACGHTFIKVSRNLDEGQNCVCLDGEHAGDKLHIEDDDVIEFLNRNAPFELSDG